MLKSVWLTIFCATLVLAFLALCTLVLIEPSLFDLSKKTEVQKQPPSDSRWRAPDTLTIPKTEGGKLISYGRELVKHTAIYLGPKGKVLHTSNGMNCQNCHLEAGTKFFGNNYAAVASTYPKFRARSGTIESIEKRVNDCIERSLNGKTLDSSSREMRAFVAYIKWIGKDVKKKALPDGIGLVALTKLDRAADPARGKLIFKKSCMRCHGSEGEGMMDENGLEWKYPPLQGKNSFNVGAGLFRLSRMAGYVKANMPNDLATFDKPALSDEQSWDVCAYIVSLPRPTKDLSKDWPDISTKPFDHPFGPYTDGISELQHKYGPFKSNPPKTK